MLTDADLKSLVADVKAQAERVARAVSGDGTAGLELAQAAVELARGRERLAKLAGRLEGPGKQKR